MAEILFEILEGRANSGVGIRGGGSTLALGVDRSVLSQLLGLQRVVHSIESSLTQNLNPVGLSS
jgi:hypothetical protein